GRIGAGHLSVLQMEELAVTGRGHRPVHRHFLPLPIKRAGVFHFVRARKKWKTTKKQRLEFFC
ncbi:MAG: hypothetical protein ORN49_11395, partial [Rhodobacteraceae bacterium]|nr:hypothetical protein [Paracoccaceae bacterium]